MPLPVCTREGCGQPAVARVASPDLPERPMPGLGFVMVRPANGTTYVGELMCGSCAHHVVDLMLLRAMPEASR